MFEDVFAQDQKQIFRRELVIPDFVGMHIGQRLAGAFAKAGTAHAGGLADDFLIELRRLKPGAQSVKQDCGIALLIAARPCTNEKPARRGRAIENVFDSHRLVRQVLSHPTSNAWHIHIYFYIA